MGGNVLVFGSSALLQGAVSRISWVRLLEDRYGDYEGSWAGDGRGQEGREIT